MYDFEDEGGWDDFEARECFMDEMIERDFPDDHWIDEGPDTDLLNEW